MRVAESSSAEARCAHAAAWLRERDRREPVTIIGATFDAAAELTRRALDQASLGWRRTTLPARAAELARAELVRRDLVPASPLALEAICARVVHEHPNVLGHLAPLRERPGVPRALARTLTEIRLAGLTPELNDGVAAFVPTPVIDRQRRRGDTASADVPRVELPNDDALAPILAAFEAELAVARLADRATTLAIAAEVAAKLPPESLLLLDVRIAHRMEAAFVGALARGDGLATLPVGDARTREHLVALFGDTIEPLRHASPLAPLQRGLFGTPDATVAEDHVTVLSAPGESRECVEIARIVSSEAARDIPFDRIAVLLRAPAYAPHVAEAFRRANIPAFFARGTKRPHPAGRAFLALLACAAERLSARRFAEYLSIGEVPDDDRGAPPAALPRSDRVAQPDEETLYGLLGGKAIAPPDEPDDDAPTLAEEDRGVAHGTVRAPRHWERLLVEAAVIGRADRWRKRLDGHAAKLTSDAAAYDAKDETALAESTRRELAALESLRAFALPLVDDLAALPERATWSTWIDKLGALATRALRHPERVLSVLAELEPMGNVENVGIGEVRLVLEPRLCQLLVPETRRRYGAVFVATPEEARGLTFDVVFVPGLAEKIFPQKVVEDPLLLDARRKRISPALATNRDRTDDERLALRLAIGAAERRVVLSYPRLDVEQAKPRTPSFYGLELLRVAEGRLGDFEHLAKKAARTADARIGWPAPPKRDEAIDEAEYDLALLKDVLDRAEDDVHGEGRYLVDAKDANPHLARALRFRWMRWDGKRLHRTDGLVSPPPEALAAIREHATDKRSFSPTALQNFAACPYRFLLSAIHKLAEREDPAAIEDLDPLTRGSLVHEVQYRLLTKLRDDGLLPIDAARLGAARERLDAVLTEVEREFHDRLNPAIDRVWKDAIGGIGADLREWLRRMPLEPDWTPAHFELSFGLKDPRSQDAKSTDEPVVLDIGLRLRGSIDLVEKKKNGALRATDHKTGKVRAKKDAVIGGGEILQPVLYALALEKLFPKIPVEAGVLYYCTAAGAFEKVPVVLDDTARRAARSVAKAVGDALHNGFLPTAPALEKKGEGACTWCDFKAVCGPYEHIRTKKKPQDGLQVLTQLRKHR
jgi:ATP-dependent helicase/nuclease subunit B